MRREGHSLSEISGILRVSKSSASNWARGIELSLKARNSILVKRKQANEKSALTHQSQTRRNLEQANTFAKEVLGNISYSIDQARLICALLYWCEGEKSKNDKSLIFTNSDPTLVKTFLRNLRKGYAIDEKKFRVCIHLHHYHNPKKQLIFWSEVTTIPLEQFTKPYQKQNGGRNVRKGYAGCASVRYYDVRIARQVHAIARAFLQKGL